MVCATVIGILAAITMVVGTITLALICRGRLKQLPLPILGVLVMMALPMAFVWDSLPDNPVTAAIIGKKEANT